MLKPGNELQEIESIERLARLARLARYCPIEVRCGDYSGYEYKDGDVVYCDPPYRTSKTEKKFYRNEDEKRKAEFAFDCEAFDEWCATRPFQVFVSGYEVPDERFVQVMSQRKISLYCASDNRTMKDEIVYTQARYAPEQAIVTCDQLSLEE